MCHFNINIIILLLKTMGRIGLRHNVKSYFLSKPPTLTFLACLLSFILTLAYFIVYIKTHDVHNPDEIDWNIFREKMASLDYCVKYQSQKRSERTLNSTNHVHRITDTKSVVRFNFFNLSICL